MMTSQQRFQSRLSLTSNRDVQGNSNTFSNEERAKMALLIKTWRAKFEKAHAASRQHSDHIKTLELEIERLKEEKNTVTSDLTKRIEDERISYEKQIKKLKLEAETARNEPEIEARYLREKLRRLQKETKPIIEIYKKRDKEMETRMVDLEAMIEEMRENEEKMKEEFNQEREELQEKLLTAQTDVGDEKTKYDENIEKVKAHCAEKIMEARQRMEEKADEETKVSIAKYEEKYENLQQEIKEKVEATREELETNFQRDLKKAVTEHKEKVHQISLEHATEMLSTQKKLEVAEVNAYHFKNEWRDFKKILEDATKKLQKGRDLYQKLVFWEFEGKMTKEQFPVTCAASMSELLEQLAVCRRELREKKKVLDRYDDNQTGHFLKNMNQNQLMLEVDFHTKANEIEYIRKLIRMKQLLTHVRPVMVKKPIRENKPVVLVMQNAAVPDLPSVEEPEEAKAKPPPRKKSAPKVKTAAKQGERDKWLYRQSSTVQLNPALNGRQRWYDNEVRNKFNI